MATRFPDADLEMEMDVLRRALDPEHAVPTVSSQALSTKVPPWGWVVMVLGVVLVLAAAVAVPVFLLRHRRPTPSVSPVSPTVTQPNRPVFPAVAPQAVLFHTDLAPSDGLTKAAYQMTRFANAQLGFVACGASTQSAFYVTDLLTGTSSAPAKLPTQGQTTVNANVFTEAVLTTEDGVTWQQCATSVDTVTVTCETVAWPEGAALNDTTFAGTLWQSGGGSISSAVPVVCSLDAQHHLTVQNATRLLATTDQVLPGAGLTILSTFYTVGQTYVLFGVVNGAANCLNYAVYPDGRTLYTLALDLTAERLMFADMTYDGRYLLVLTTARLMMYARHAATAEAPFTVQDMIYLAADLTTATECSLDRTNTSQSQVWCQLSLATKYSIILPFNQTTLQFQLAEGRQVPVLSTCIDTLGPSAVHMLSISNQLFLVQADSQGHAATVILDLSLL